MDKEQDTKLLKKKIEELIDKGFFFIKKDEIVFPLNVEDDIYIYRYEDKYRVMIPHPFKEGKKYHVGYFSSFKKAKKARDSIIKAVNMRLMKKLLKTKKS